jgi:hypothetical protein
MRCPSGGGKGATQMSVVSSVLQVIQILAPLIEETVKAISAGKVPDFVQTLPSPLRSRVALEAKKAGLK